MNVLKGTANIAGGKIGGQNALTLHGLGNEQATANITGGNITGGVWVNESGKPVVEAIKKEVKPEPSAGEPVVEYLDITVTKQVDVGPKEQVTTTKVVSNTGERKAVRQRLSIETLITEATGIVHPRKLDGPCFCVIKQSERCVNLTNFGLCFSWNIVDGFRLKDVVSSVPQENLSQEGIV